MSITPLEPGEVRVWYHRVDHAQPQAYDALLALLSPAEAARAARFRQLRDRCSYIAAHALKRLLLSRASGACRPPEWAFITNRHGRPEPAAADCPLRFSLTHTDGLAACAISEAAVGLDAEPRARTAIEDIAARVLTPPELADLDRCAAEARGERFILYWTLKEAYLKALGTGLTGSMRSLTLDVSDERSPRILAAHDDRAWHLATFCVEDAHRISVCIQPGATDPIIRLTPITVDEALASAALPG